MTDNTILQPEIGLIKKDEFYLFYEMMMQALKTDDVKDGLNKTLFLLRTYLKSGNIALFRKNEDGIYVFNLSDSKMNELVQPIGCIINKTHPIIEQRTIFNLDLNLSERLKNMVLIHMDVSGNSDECILAIINNDKEKSLEPQFWDRVKDTMQIILKRATSYERNTKAVTTDLLTGLDNRNSYEMRLSEINEEDDQLILAIFDLFRLKYINDNFTHAKGDQYITEIANILNKKWPKEKIKTNDDGSEETIKTGHCVYRVGGDEFVLLTNVENLHLTNLKAGLVSEEVEYTLDLGLPKEEPIGINYGVVQHKKGNSIKQTFMRADELMQEDKTKMYLKYNKDRRQH